MLCMSDDVRQRTSLPQPASGRVATKQSLPLSMADSLRGKSCGCAFQVSQIRPSYEPA